MPPAHAQTSSSRLTVAVAMAAIFLAQAAPLSARAASGTEAGDSISAQLGGTSQFRPLDSPREPVQQPQARWTRQPVATAQLAVDLGAYAPLFVAPGVGALAQLRVTFRGGFHLAFGGGLAVLASPHFRDVGPRPWGHGRFAWGGTTDPIPDLRLRFEGVLSLGYLSAVGIAPEAFEETAGPFSGLTGSVGSRATFLKLLATDQQAPGTAIGGFLGFAFGPGCLSDVCSLHPGFEFGVTFEVGQFLPALPLPPEPIDWD